MLGEEPAASSTELSWPPRCLQIPTRSLIATARINSTRFCSKARLPPSHTTADFKDFCTKAPEPGADLFFLERQRRQEDVVHAGAPGYLCLQEQQLNIAGFKHLPDLPEASTRSGFCKITVQGTPNQQQQQQLSPLTLLRRTLKICHHMKQREISVRH